MDSSLPGLRERNRTGTRTRLVRAAFELFAAEGFDAVPVERICDAASVSRATFFNYFSQKDELLVEIGRQRIERLQQFMAAQQAWDEKPNVDSLIDLFAEFAANNEELTPLGRHVFVRALSNPAVAGQMAELMQILRAKVAEYLGRLLVSKRLRAFDPVATAENAVAIYFWSTLEFTLHPDPQMGELTATMRRRLGSLFAPLRRNPSPRRTS